MKRIYGIIPAGMIPFLLSALLFSCIEDNYRDIRIDDSTRWEPYLALPVGAGTVGVNDFFRQYIQPDSFPSDTTRVFFNDSLYRLAQTTVLTEYRLDFSIEEYIDSSRYIQKGLVFFRVTNQYPTAARLQLYLYRNQQEVIDSVFPQPQPIEAGRTRKDSIVDAPSVQLLKVNLSRKQINRLFVADGVLLHGRIFLENEALGKVYLFPNKGIDVEVFLRVQLSLKKEDLWEE
ncbi:MAG: hypothetical protein KGY60_12315 [Bacteroidales bacterium]|nr:hypothetical protein [Bacteroidales bacterium]